MYQWIKFIVFSAAGLSAALGFLYYLIAKRDDKMKIKTWKIYLALFAICAFLADRYYREIFE